MKDVYHQMKRIRNKMATEASATLNNTAVLTAITNISGTPNPSPSDSIQNVRREVTDLKQRTLSGINDLSNSLKTITFRVNSKKENGPWQ